MGVDATLYAQGDVSDAELDAANKYLSERLRGAPGGGYGNGLWLGRSEDDFPDRIEFDTLGRYYGPGYERGDWPTIYGYIVTLRAALPSCTVHYGPDSEWDNLLEVTDESLAEMWAHFLGPHGADYRVTP